MYTILIVDDNADDREFITRTIASLNDVDCTVLEADRKSACMEICSSQTPPDCVLLDYSLPGANGLATLSEILDAHEFTSVIMITSQGNEAIAADAIKRGAQDYIVKSHINTESLGRSIRNATQRVAMAKHMRDQQDSLSTFAHVLVHDLRAPLRAIRGATQLLQNGLPADLSDSNRENLQFILDGAVRMDQLIQALQQYTETAGPPPTFEDVGFSTVLDAVRKNLRADLDAAGATLSFNIELPVIHINVPQVTQLLQNIVANGIKYNTSPQPQVLVNVQEENGYWKVEVTDNGIGIESADLEKIFEPFKRLHAQSRFSGTGLGLATCKKIVDRHNGRIWCTSKVDQGTTFTILFPIKAVWSEPVPLLNTSAPLARVG